MIRIIAIKGSPKTTICLVLFCLIILLGSCTNKKSSDLVNNEPRSYPYSINIADGLKNTSDIKLSEIADSIKYVVLSKDKDIIINNLSNIEMIDNDIFVQLVSLVHRFNLSGNFLNTIGQFGRGPQEYLNGSMYAVNPVSKKVYVYRNFISDFISYDFDGNYIDKVPIKSDDYVGNFKCFSDSCFLIFPAYMRNIPDNMILCGLIDQYGNRLYVIDHPAKNTPTNTDLSRFTSRGPGGNETYLNFEVVSMCDFNTAYKINGDSIYPAFILDWGNLPRPETFEEKYGVWDRSKRLFMTPYKIFETYSETFFVLYDNFNYFLIEYDKYTGVTNSMIMKDQEKVGFINDIDGGASYYPKWTNMNGDIWIDCVDAIDFKKMHDEEFLSNSKAIYPKRKDDLKSFLNELQIDDNPVLKIVYLKKQFNDQVDN